MNACVVRRNDVNPEKACYRKCLKTPSSLDNFKDSLKSWGSRAVAIDDLPLNLDCFQPLVDRTAQPVAVVGIAQPDYGQRGAIYAKFSDVRFHRRSIAEEDLLRLRHDGTNGTYGTDGTDETHRTYSSYRFVTRIWHFAGDPLGGSFWRRRWYWRWPCLWPWGRLR